MKEMKEKLLEEFEIKSIVSGKNIDYHCVSYLSESGDNATYVYSYQGGSVTITQDAGLSYYEEAYYGKLISKIYLKDLKDTFTTEQLNDSMVEDYLKRNPEKLGDMVNRCLSLQKTLHEDVVKTSSDLAYVLDTVSKFLKKDGVKVYEALKKNVLGK